MYKARTRDEKKERKNNVNKFFLLCSVERTSYHTHNFLLPALFQGIRTKSRVEGNTFYRYHLIQHTIAYIRPQQIKIN